MVTGTDNGGDSPDCQYGINRGSDAQVEDALRAYLSFRVCLRNFSQVVRLIVLTAFEEELTKPIDFARKTVDLHIYLANSKH